MKQVGVFIVRLAVSVVLYVVAAGLAEVTAAGISGRGLVAGGLAEVFSFSLVLPVWFAVPMSTRCAAGGVGVGVGIVLWMLAQAVIVLAGGLAQASEGALLLAAVFQSAAGVGGAVAAYLFIRAARKGEQSKC